MAVDYFLKIDGIEGDSHDAAHKNEIELISYDWTESQSGSFAQGGGGGVGKVHMENFKFVMYTSKASPKLALYCANGKHIKEATLTCRKAGEGQLDFYTIKLTDIIIAQYRTMSQLPTDASDTDHDSPADQFSFNFGKIEFEYKPQKEDGALDTPVKAGYNVKTNKTV